MKIVAAAERFRNGARRILLEPHEDGSRASRVDGVYRLHFGVSGGVGGGSRVLDQLAVYFVALGDLDDGVAHPMFEVKNGDPSIGSQIWRLRGMCAVAQEYLMLAKGPVEDPANKPSVDYAKKVARIPGIEKLLSGRAKCVDPDARKIDAHTSVSNGEKPPAAARRWTKRSE